MSSRRTRSSSQCKLPQPQSLKRTCRRRQQTDMPYQNATAFSQPVQSNINALAYARNATAKSGAICKPPTTQETYANLSLEMKQAVDSNDNQFRSAIATFEQQHNVHEPPAEPVLLPPPLYKYGPHTRWTKEELDDWLANKDNVLGAVPSDGPLSKKKIFESFLVLMSSNRSVKSMEDKLNQITSAANKPDPRVDKNKQPLHGYKYSQFCALKQQIEKYRCSLHTSSKKQEISRYTKLLQKKAANKQEKKRQQDQEKKELDLKVKSVCDMMVNSMQFEQSTKQQTVVAINKIRDLIDELLENPDNTLDKDALTKLQRFTLTHPEQVAAEYLRVSKKYASPIQIIRKLCALSNLL